MTTRIYADRTDAARALARPLGGYTRMPGTMVLGLARGGVPVAAVLARRLGLPYGALVVRKLGVPGHGETAFGALAILDGTVATWLNKPFEQRLLSGGCTAAELDAVAVRERAELLARAARYPAPVLPPAPATLILADDGLATGATMCAAVLAIRGAHPATIVAAAPVGSWDAIEEVRTLADKVVCPLVPPRFNAVGSFYRDFGQTSDAEVLALLGA
ncbi:phosphoribosyltransferase [Arthrobacter sp. 35W]|uniref:phosphoribosyltransferase n=1 Tax=Arthrobacter sp. 35W TaxID=1132441 RepID=UPI00047B6B10|nr:phosphoribosyltransferase family protein [Arthrobacter sp. 35W]